MSETDTKPLLVQRREKLDRLIEAGYNPYDRSFEQPQRIADLLEPFEEERDVHIAGRIMALRRHGKALFGDVRDVSGKLQLYIKADELGEAAFERFVDCVDIGDMVVLSGKLFTTRRGEKTISVASFTVVAKALRPLPEKWHGLKDIEQRYRQRYVDLIVNETARTVFTSRAHIIRSIRDQLHAEEYLEVETPVMHDIPGGASGRPFKTHHNALDLDLYMRLAPELYLKRLLVGGLERVYELNKSFRNEGLSTRHNPEFTMLEVYRAYGNYKDMMSLTVRLIRTAAREVLGTTKIMFQGQEIDLGAEWKVWSFAEVMKDSFDINPDDPIERWLEKLKKSGALTRLPSQEKMTRSWLINLIGDLLEVDTSNVPVFVVDYPVEISPLAKQRSDDPRLVERFELYMGGMELANGYTELNDPREQLKRFEEQLAGYDPYEGSKQMDRDFIRALEYGMPPAGGLGIGIDRLIMLLTDQASIRDTILFPQLKPESMPED